MKKSKKYPGILTSKIATTSNSRGVLELARKLTKEIAPLQTTNAIKELMKIIEEYQSEIYSHNISFKLYHDVLIDFIKTKKEELHLIHSNPDIADFLLYGSHLDEVKEKIRFQIQKAELKLQEVPNTVSKNKGSFHINELILQLLQLRKNHGLTFGHTYDPYSDSEDSNDSKGACVPWVMLVVNTLNKNLFPPLTNQAIKERIIKMKSRIK